MNSLSNDAVLTGNVFAIQRYFPHEGPGIRTTVFLKDCALRVVSQPRIAGVFIGNIL